MGPHMGNGDENENGNENGNFLFLKKYWAMV